MTEAPATLSPAETGRLLRWFAARRRDLPWRQDRSPYPVWVAEVMLQQTRIETAIPYYRRWLERFPTVHDLAAAPLADVLKQWEGLGYYSRARHMHAAARRVIADFGGEFPRQAEEIAQLPGIGPYITAAIASIAFGQALPVLDGNVARVATRFFAIAGRIDRLATRRPLLESLQRSMAGVPAGDFNEAMMELGETICTPTAPACPDCPLRTGCRALKEGLVAELPVRPPPRQVPRYRVAVAVLVRSDGAIYVQRRPDKGHLGGLWEFPGGKARGDEALTATLTRECREELGIPVQVIAPAGQVHHQYTHFHIDLAAFVCRFPGDFPPPAQAHRWIRWAERSLLPFPTANHKLFPAIEAALAVHAPEALAILS